jgi:transposase
MAPGNRNKPKRAASSDATYTVLDFMRDFPDDTACLDWLWRQLHSWDGSHAECPKCEQLRKFHRVASRPSYSCDTCGHHIHPTANTIFHKSSTTLRHWFHAIFLMASTRCGISAKQLERELGVTYKTAWRMFHLIRELLLENDEPLSGEVEMDETYVGGKARLADKAQWKHLSSPGRRQAAQKWADKKKTTVFGMVERGGRVNAYVVPRAFQGAAFQHIEARVLPEATVYTDEAPAYQPLGAKGYQHKRIHHAAKVYVEGDVHTNTIEGFWSLVKRGIGGTHHAVSAKYLQGYLNEYAWRYNHRKDKAPMFFTLLGNVEKGQGVRLADG